MFATDRDLLVLEPRLFLDVSWTAQRLVESATGGTINAAGDTLTIAGVNLVSLGVDAGFVAVAGNTPLEVTQRVDSTTLKISRPRGSDNEAAIPAASGSGLKVTIHTFRPQIGIVHDQLLRLLGIEPTAPADPDVVGEAAITNPRALALAEALGALHLVFSSAAAVVGADSPIWTKAQMYRDRFAAERRRLSAEVDLDGDGKPDAVRRANVLRFVRG